MSGRRFDKRRGWALAIAQIAGCGVIIAIFFGMEAEGWLVRLSALGAALAGALLLTWTEKRWPESQEAIIGSAFVLAASGAILLLAVEGQHHGGAEHLKDMLVGQILWVNWRTVALVAVAYALLLAVWFGVPGVREKRAGFYVVFAFAVTASVQLVGLYLVFASLIMPVLATRNYARHRLLSGYCAGAAGYVLGLIASVFTDLPSGAAIVWVLGIVCIAFHAFGPARVRATAGTDAHV